MESFNSTQLEKDELVSHPPKTLSAMEEARKCMKGIRTEEIAEKEEDRISALPDCLVVEILSRLKSTKGAITTGALSKRWKHLWTLLPNLIFENYCGTDFFSFVNKTITQLSCQFKLNKFKLHTPYNTRFKSQVNSWIRYAVNCNVQVLNLRLWSKDFFDLKDVFLLDQFFFISSCFTNLALAGCKLNPTGDICWKNLRTLTILHGNLGEDLIKNILSGSPVLETLVLGYCYGYERLDITSKSVKNLVFSGYNGLPNIIEINAPNILSLTIRNHLWLWKLLLLDVSSLVKVDLHYKKVGHSESTCEEEEEDMLKGIIQNLHHVKELQLGRFCFKALSRLEAKGIKFPSNLKVRDNNSLVDSVYSDDDSLELGDWIDI